MIGVGHAAWSYRHTRDGRVLGDDDGHAGERELRFPPLVGRVDLLGLGDRRPSPERSQRIEDPVGEPCMIQMVDDHLCRRRNTVLNRRRNTRSARPDPRMPTTHVALPCPV
jgi:hypothetical protein